MLVSSVSLGIIWVRFQDEDLSALSPTQLFTLTVSQQSGCVTSPRADFLGVQTPSPPDIGSYPLEEPPASPEKIQ